jgi:hypothetical protein
LKPDFFLRFLGPSYEESMGGQALKYFFIEKCSEELLLVFGASFYSKYFFQIGP